MNSLPYDNVEMLIKDAASDEKKRVDSLLKSADEGVDISNLEIRSELAFAPPAIDKKFEETVDLFRERDPKAGVKNDKGKDDWSLLFGMPIVEETVKVLTFGAKKYAPYNYQHVKGWKWRYVSALTRHMMAMLRGETKDPESGFSHGAHFVCCALMLADNFLTDAPNGDDR